MPPPTRAKRAIDEAPNEKPVMIVMTFPIDSASVPIIFPKIKKSNPRPRRPSPTTPSPMTEPPAKAIFSPSPRLVRAPCVVRTFALVATRIPIKPARAEQTAPTMNETATSGELFSSRNPWNKRSKATAPTKMESTLYSARRNAIAPSAIFLAIRPIWSDPASCFSTQADFQKVKASARTPNSGMMTSNVVMIV